MASFWIGQIKKVTFLGGLMAKCDERQQKGNIDIIVIVEHVNCKFWKLRDIFNGDLKLRRLKMHYSLFKPNYQLRTWFDKTWIDHGSWNEMQLSSWCMWKCCLLIFRKTGHLVRSSREVNGSRVGVDLLAVCERN